MIVVDTNVLAYLVMPGDFNAVAEQLLQRDGTWLAPRLWRSELRNVLLGYLRRGTLGFDEVVRFQTRAEAQMDGFEHEVDSASVLTLCMSSRCTAYDCEFVALARQLSLPLVTMDRKVLAAFPDCARGLGEEAVDEGKARTSTEFGPA